MILRSLVGLTPGMRIHLTLKPQLFAAQHRGVQTPETDLMWSLIDICLWQPLHGLTWGGYKSLAHWKMFEYRKSTFFSDRIWGCQFQIHLGRWRKKENDISVQRWWLCRGTNITSGARRTRCRSAPNRCPRELLIKFSRSRLAPEGFRKDDKFAVRSIHQKITF